MDSRKRLVEYMEPGSPELIVEGLEAVTVSPKSSVRFIGLSWDSVRGRIGVLSEGVAAKAPGVAASEKSSRAAGFFCESTGVLSLEVNRGFGGVLSSSSSKYLYDISLYHRGQDDFHSFHSIVCASRVSSCSV